MSVVGMVYIFVVAGKKSLAHIHMIDEVATHREDQYFIYNIYIFPLSYCEYIVKWSQTLIV